MKSFFVVVLTVVVAVVAAKNVPFGAALLNSRIINGETADVNEFPHQVMLMYNDQFICGGSLIHEDWVLTAAHCIVSTSTNLFTIKVNAQPIKDGVEYSVTHIITHKDYGKGQGAYPNDVALVQIDRQNADLSGNVIEPAADGTEDFTAHNCVISGFGTTETGSVASELLKTDVKVLDQATCSRQDIWGTNIIEQHICVEGVGDQGSGACNGDSGGPLVCNGKLAGVTSWGASGCHVNMVVTKPSVYARVTHFHAWIKSTCECI